MQTTQQKGGPEDNILEPVRIVDLGALGKVEARELTWKEYLWVIQQVTGVIMELVDKNGALALTNEKMVAAIMAQEDIVSRVIAKCTGKDQAWVDKLTMSQAMAVVEAFVGLNLTPEIVSLGKRVAGRIGDAFRSQSRSPGQ